MTRVIYYTATTLDGYLADDQDSLEWLFDVDQTADGFSAFFATVGALVQGSTTYEWVLAHERLLENPQKWRDFYGDRPAWVFSGRERAVVDGADVRVVSGAVTDHWASIRASAGDRDVWIAGGGDLAGQFADAGLLDEIRLSVAPVTLGSGKPLLPRRLLSADLRLRAVAQNGQFAELTYEVRR